MTTKINKKDRLAALMTIWETLRALETLTPSDKTLLVAAQRELAPLLDLHEPEKQNVNNVVEANLKLREELKIARATVLHVFDSLKRMVELGKQDKRDEVVTEVGRLLSSISKQLPDAK